MRNALATTLLLLGASCGGIEISSNSLAVPPGAVVTLSEVHFDYDAWTNTDEEDMTEVKGKEAGWRAIIERAFRERAQDLDLEGGDGPNVSVELRIIDLDQGSQAARYWIGFGAGSGSLKATVNAGEYGSCEAEGRISGGSFGGDFDGVLENLGEAVAEAIAESRD